MDSIKTNKKGRMAAVICRLFGYVILAAVIVSLLPVTVPRFLGYEIYSVASGSMEPEIPVGSIVYVKPVSDPVTMEEGEVIAFHSGSSVVMHRIVSNHQTDGYFTTKGDANEQEDMGEVTYENLIGRVVRHVPMMGQVFLIYTSPVGRILAACMALCGVLLLVLAAGIGGAAR